MWIRKEWKKKNKATRPSCGSGVVESRGRSNPKEEEEKDWKKRNKKRN